MTGIFLLSLLLSWPSLCFAWADSWEEIAAAAKEVNSISADFVQEKHLPMLARPLISHGRLAYRRPHRLRWEYRSPVKSVLLVTDGDVRRFVQSDGELVADAGAHLQAMGFVMPEISGWLGGRFRDNPMFAATIQGENRIVMIPRDEAVAGFIHRIELVMGEAPGVIERVLIFEGEEAYTKMVFHNTKINPDLAPRLFMEAR